MQIGHSKGLLEELAIRGVTVIVRSDKRRVGKVKRQEAENE
jgi:hypothetical protein